MHHHSYYLTFKNYVYLGKVGPRVRKRAKRAGLVIITRTEYRKLIMSHQAIDRLIFGGVWYDTVNYAV